LSASVWGGLRVAHADRRVAGWRLAAGAAGVAENALFQAREIGKVLIDERVAGSAKSVEPILDIRGVARLRHFAVVDQVNARLGLLLHDFGHGCPYAGGKSLCIDRHALFLGVHHADEIIRTRQAAGMGGQKTVATTLHDLGSPI